MPTKHLDKLELVGVIIGGLGLLYTLFRSTAPSPTLAGASPPVLLGSGGDSGGTGLSPLTGSGGTPDNAQPYYPTLQLPNIPAIDVPALQVPANGAVTVNGPGGNITSGPTIGGSTFLSLLGGTGSSGCCQQVASVPYLGSTPAMTAAATLPPITPPDVGGGYPVVAGFFTQVPGSG